MATHEGPPLVRNRLGGKKLLSEKAVASASSQAGPLFGAGRVLDGNYATRWAAAKEAQGAWLQLDLGRVETITRQEVRLEYAWKPYRFAVEQSDDGQSWSRVEDFTGTPATGSPLVIAAPAQARYLRLVSPVEVKGSDLSLFEWAVF